MLQGNSSQAALGLGAVSLLGAAAYVAFAGKVLPVHRRGGIIVTGASTGIGRHAAETLAGRGFTVFAGVRRAADAEKLKEVSNHFQQAVCERDLWIEWQGRKLQTLMACEANSGQGRNLTALLGNCR